MNFLVMTAKTRFERLKIRVFFFFDKICAIFELKRNFCGIIFVFFEIH